MSSISASNRSAPSRNPSHLDSLPQGGRVLVVRLRSLGDCVLTTPAITLLKTFRPDLHIAVVVEDRFREIFEANPDIEDLLVPEVGAVRAWRADLAVNFHGGTRSMKLMAACGAHIRAGFGHHSGSFVYNAKIPRAQAILGKERPVHTAEHLASAMFWLGVPQCEIPRAKLVANSTVDIPTRAYAVIHPFASAPEKAWKIEGFLDVARHLRDQAGLTPVIVAGPDDDVAAFDEFRVYRNAPLSDIKSVMAGAQIFVGNDSGPAHVAAAFGVPVVVLFGTSNPVTWAPWRTEARVLTAPAEAGGMNAIETAQVIGAIDELRAHSAQSGSTGDSVSFSEGSSR